MPSPLAVIIGPPGSGKSTLAHRLAEMWGVESRDTDADVVEADGREISDIFLESGESAFRSLERQAVAHALATHPGVLALGGGAILDADTRADLLAYAAAGGTIVYLEIGRATAARRVGLAHSRPLLVASPRREWARLMEERRPLYEELATVTVATDGTKPRATAERVAKLVQAGKEAR